MRVEDLGKRATFLIPSVKVYNRRYSKKRQGVVRLIHRFLLATFGGYTCTSGNIFGFSIFRTIPRTFPSSKSLFLV